MAGLRLAVSRGEHRMSRSVLLWAYPSKAAALAEGARLAMAVGLEDASRTAALYEVGRYGRSWNATRSSTRDTHLLPVQPAFLQDERS